MSPNVAGAEVSPVGSVGAVTAVTTLSAVTEPDGVARCPWAITSPLLRDYHDVEWGVRVSGESAYFERLTLEAFQSGLSWSTILAKRPAFREHFAGFEVDAVAAYGPDDVERLMSEPGIVRNRRKIEATLVNARAAVALREHGGLEEFVLQHRPDREIEPLGVTTTPESHALSKALKARGFTFVGPTTMHALTEALGLFDPHLRDCHRRGLAVSRG